MFKRSFGLLIPALALAFLGLGCQKPTTQQGVIDAAPTGPKVAVFDALSPEQSTKKLVLTNQSVITIKQNFQEGSEKIVNALGWGPEVTRDIVIRRFAPGNLAEIEWKARTKFQNKGKVEDRQQVGSLVAINLQSSHDLLLPSYWTEGDRNIGNGASAIWLSSEVYENFAKARASTFLPGLTNTQLFDLLKFPKELSSAANTLSSELKKKQSKQAIDYATSDAEFVHYDVNANGQRVTVNAMQIKSWFGTFLVLANPQNPIVLKFTPSKELQAVGLPGFFGFQVTDFKDIQE